MTTEELTTRFAEDKETFEARMKGHNPEDEGDVLLYTGLKHFCQPEIEAYYQQFPPEKPVSNSQKKKEAAEMARGIAIMSVAHRKAIIEAEPTAIRLSSHPKPANAEQMGAHLDPEHNPSGTPWHNAVLLDIQVDTGQTTEVYVKASEAREKGAIECTYPLGSRGEHVPKEEVEAAFKQTKIRSSHLESEAALLAKFGALKGKSFALNVDDKDKEKALDLCEKAGVKPGAMIYKP